MLLKCRLNVQIALILEFVIFLSKFPRFSRILLHRLKFLRNTYVAEPNLATNNAQSEVEVFGLSSLRRTRH